MKTLVLAAGQMRRWGGGTPKHMVEVEGETLLHRTVEQFAPYGPVEIIQRPGRPYSHPQATSHNARLNPDNQHADRFCSSYHRWDPDDTMLLVYGDVWFSDRAVETMAAPRDDWAWFARLGPSDITGYDRGEGFGFLLPPHTQAPFRAAVEKALELRKGRAGISPTRGWAVWQVFEGTVEPPFQRAKKRWPLPHWVEVNDWTDDFDRKKDLAMWLDRRREKNDG